MSIFISVITRWYNEEFFAPFFLNHYCPWADEVIVLLEKNTKDNCRSVIKKYPNARYEFVETEEKLNDRILSDILSDLAMSLKSDWVIRADADEYTFPKGFGNPRESLEKADGNVINNWYRWVYRHYTEKDLDPSLPTVPQRRHGGAYTIWKGMGDKYLKPTIVKPEVGVRWYPGDQRIHANNKVIISSTVWDGVHWQMADVEHAIKRNHKNESRLSEENIKNNWGVKKFTPEMIRKECESHLHDPQVV